MLIFLIFFKPSMLTDIFSSECLGCTENRVGGRGQAGHGDEANGYGTALLKSRRFGLTAFMPGLKKGGEPPGCPMY
jgi:hypothetical protein